MAATNGYFMQQFLRIARLALLTLFASGTLHAQAQWTALTAPGQATRAVAADPTVLAVAKSARLLAVGHDKSKAVAFYHPDTAALLGTTNLPKEPIAVALSDDGTKAYALYDSSGIKIAVINTATRTISSTWSTSGTPVGMALNGTELLIADKNGDRLVGINATTGAVTRSKSLTKEPLMIAVGASGALVLVGTKDGQLQLIDSSTLAVTRIVTVGDDIRSLAWWEGSSGTSGRALAVGKSQNALNLVDPTTGAIARVALGGDPNTVGVEQHNNWAYVGEKDDQIISLIDLIDRALVGYFTIPGQIGSLLFDQQGGLLFVTLSKDDKLLKLDPNQASMISKVGVTKTFKDVAVNGDSSEGIAISDKDTDFARVNLSTHAVQSLVLPVKADKVAVDSILNVAIIGATNNKLSFVNLATVPASLYPQQVDLDGNVKDMAVDPTRGITVAIVSDKQRVRVVNNATRTEIAAIQTPDKYVAVAIHSGKGIAYLATDNKKLSLFNLTSRTVTQTIGLNFDVEGMAIDPALNRAVLTAKDQDKAWILNLDTLQFVTSLAMAKKPGAVAIQTDTHIAVVASKDDDSLSLIDLSNNTATLNFNRIDKPTGLAISNRFNKVLVVSSDKDDLAIVQLSNPVATASAIAPMQSSTGASATTLTVTGTRFVDGAIVYFGATALVTTWVSSGTLIAVIPASSLTTAGTINVRVLNPTPAGGYSASLVFTVGNSAPVLDSISPSSVNADNLTKTFTLTGSNFQLPVSVVVSASAGTQTIAAATTATPSTTSIQVVLPATLFTSAGTLTLAVKTDVGTSNAKTVTITAIAPAAPTIGTAVAGNANANVTFTPPASNGGSVITSYTATSSPGNVTGTCTAPCTSIAVTGLSNGVSYTFAVKATNAVGTGPASANSNAVTPIAAVPSLLSSLPASLKASSQTQSIVLTGTNFIAPVKVRFDGNVIDATPTSATQLTVSIPGTLLTTVKTAALTIVAAGGTSNVLMVSIVAPPPDPFLYSSAPATLLALGQAIPITLAGQNFVSGAIVLLSTGAGPTPTTLSAAFINNQQLKITIPAANTMVPTTLILKIQNPDGGTSNEYNLPVTAPELIVSAIAPARGAVGSTITIYGTGFSANPADNVVTFAGNAPGAIQSATTTSLVLTVPATAQTGAVKVAVGTRTVNTPIFTVGQTPEQDFAFGANAALVVLYQGSSTSVDVQLNNAGSLGYQNLAKLTVSGVPQGVSAKFSRPYLTSGGSASLVLTADANASIGVAPLTITASGDTSAGIDSKSTTVSVDVRTSASVTGVKGRFVDDKGVGIGGVLVRVGDNQIQSDSAGNFTIINLIAGDLTLRFDATPAHPLYPIWPYTVKIETGRLITITDWVINPPPADDKFVTINNATGEQQVTDPRYPGFAIRLPQGVSITGWDGVKKTRIAVERHDPDQSPTVAPPIATKSLYQLYFGTPMGGIPSSPIPVTLPNETSLEPGEQTEIWFFDGSPMGGDGMWKVAGAATVSADGKTVVMNPGQGIPRFCGVCGLVCVKNPVPSPPDPPPPTCTPPSGGGGSGSTPASKCTAGNPVQLSNGQEFPIASDMALGGLIPIALTRYYNPADAFNNTAGTAGSIGYGWGFEYDVVMLPFEGPQKRIIMPGNQKVNFEQQPDGTYKNSNNFRFQGAVLRQINGNEWRLEFADKTTWKFNPFPGITGFIRGGVPLFLVEQRTVNGQVLNMGRLPNGRITSVGTPERSVTMSYGSNGFVSEITDPINRKVRFTYASNDRIATVTNAEGGVTRYEYGSFQGDYPLSIPPVAGNDATCVQILNESQNPTLGVPLKSIQYPGTTNKTMNTLGYGGRVLRQVLADGSEYRFRYTIVGGCRAARPGVAYALRTCTATNDSCVQSYERAELGEHVFGGAIVAVTVIDPKGRETTVRFTPQGTAAAQNDEQGQPASFKRDSVGRIIESTDVLGRTMKYTFDGHGNVTRSIDSLGRVTDMTYDAIWKKPTTITRYLDNGTPVTSSNTYNATTGNLTSSTNAEGNSSTFAYNGKGQVNEVTNPLGHKTKFEYNAAGDLTKVIDPLLNEVAMEPDLAGRTIKLTDPLQFVTRVEHNGLDQTTKIIDADLGETRMAYNGKHLLASVTDPLNQVIERYDYDDMYRPTQRTDASGKLESNSYDAIGQIVAHTDRRGQGTSISYDEKDRPLNTAYVDGSRIERRYDAVGRLVKLIRSGTGLDETFIYRLDSADRLTELIRAVGSRTDTLTYNYDTLNRVKSRSVNGESTVYTYDKAGRIVTISHKGQTTQYSWDAVGRLTQKTLPNGIKQQMVYNNAGRLTSLIYKNAADATIEQIDYTYDARGQRIGMTTQGSYPVARDVPIEALYNSANRLTSLTLKGVGTNNADETSTLSYDDNGNLIEKRGQGTIAGSITTYMWDKQNRLTAMSQTGTDAITASFSYDQFGRRTNKSVTINGQTNAASYVYDGDQAVAEQVNGVTTSQLTGIAVDEHIARYTGQDQLVYLTDALGSIIAQTKADGSFQNKYGYSPYGQVATDTDDKSNPHQYTGRENDKTGLLFYRARYYMPSCGRFISEDPIGTAGGMNIYGYASGNPIQNKDSSGRWSEAAHNNILRGLYGGCLTPGSMADLMRGSLDVDGDGITNAVRNQFGGDPAEHAMRNPGETPADAERRMRLFIDRELDLAARNPKDAFFHYGRALHPIMDSTSPLHEGFQVWDPLNWRNARRNASHGHEPGEGPAQVTPARRRQTEQAVRNYASELNDLCKAY